MPEVARINQERVLISDEYREINQQMHEEKESYGISGQKWIRALLDISGAINSKDVLDYGCGKGTLAKNVPFLIKQYDPCIPKHSAPPDPADIVVCTDVLEHVEPEYIDNVLDDLARLALKACILTVATRPALKTLPDGRNAHLIQEPVEWWVPKLCARFNLAVLQNMGESIGREFLVVLEAKDD